MSDAVNYYMTAYATADIPSSEMKAHVKRLVGEGDALKPMFDSGEFLKGPDQRAPIQDVTGRLMGRLGTIPGVMPFLRPCPVLEAP